MIFGFAGGVAFTGAGTFIKQSGEITHQYQLDEIVDDDNEIVTLIHSKEKYEFTFLFTPRAATGTNTLANAAASLEPPAKGAAVTLSTFKLASANAADWVYCGDWKLAFDQKGIATYSLKIMRSPNNNLSTAVT